YLAQAQSLEQGIRAIVHAHVDWIVDNPDWADFIFHHRVVLAGVDAEPVQQQELQASFAQIVDWMKAHAAGGARLRWPLDTYAALVTGPVHEYARHWLAGRRRTSLADLREFFAEAAIRAVGVAG
ncbi:MAG: TetR/AcrR family transcriptional regulator, partial [Perlucidibaca sp.]